MKILNSVVILILALIISNTAFSQDKLDSTYLEEQTIANIDSLMSGWYVKTSLNSNNQNKDVFSNEHFIDIADSIIIERMQKIATPIHLSYNQDVRNWINLYLKRGKYMIPTIMGMSEYYFPMFEEELMAHDMPIELKYLPIIESALNPRAVSRAGATGIWQFIYATGKRYGLEINSYIDERRDPMKSTKAAVAYLGDLYGIFGDWNLALAGYNCGAGNVQKAIVRSGGKTDFWEIYRFLPKETRSYVPAFIAITYIMNYTEEHNFYPASIELPLNTDTVMITDTLHLTQVAEVLEIPIEQLRDLNPQYKIDIIPGHIKPYPLRLPMANISAFLMNEDKIYDYKDSIIFSQKFVVKQTNTYKQKYDNNYSYTPTPCPDYDLSGKGQIIYTVKAGDTFSFISEWYDVSVEDIKCWNNLSSTKINVGQKLVIYEPLKKLSYYQNLNTKTFEQKQEVASDRKVQQQRLDPNFIYYTIKSGDNLFSIAQKFDGVSHEDIMKINSFSDSDVSTLQIGQVIKIKRRN
ncbi:MAG: transglycosylase SLT domain-containing protein [Bacteroidales bacterium]|nr:transglycosylase SLT domain-containing protein [Bacteroidales bacterium]